MSAESDFGFLNLSRFYRVSQKNLNPCLMGHKGRQKWHEDKSSVRVLEKFIFYLECNRIKTAEKKLLPIQLPVSSFILSVTELRQVFENMNAF